MGGGASSQQAIDDHDDLLNHDANPDWENFEKIDQTEWVDYEDDTVRLKHPSLWWAGQTNLDLRHEPAYFRTIKSRFGITVRISKQQIDFSMTAAKWVANYKQQLKASRVFTSDKASRLGEFSAIEFDNKHQAMLPNRVAVKVQQRIIVRDSGDETPREGKQLFTVTITAGVKVFKKYEQVLQRLVDTIVFY